MMTKLRWWLAATAVSGLCLLWIQASSQRFALGQNAATDDQKQKAESKADHSATDEQPAQKKKVGQGKNAQKKNPKKAAGTSEFNTPGANAEDARSMPDLPQNAPVADFVKLAQADAAANGAKLLSIGDSFDDFVSVVQTKTGGTYAAYMSYYNGHDQIRLHSQLPDGNWSTWTPVPVAGERADLWMPQLAVDANDNVWVIWSEQTGQAPDHSGNWDIYARMREATKWGPLIRLTEDAKPDINPHVASDAQGNIHVVWQAHPRNSGDVQYSRFDGQAWSKPLAVTSDEESDWYPRVAVDHSGTAWIAFDSYRRGDYDVLLTSVTNGQPGPVLPVATSSFYEAHASVACTRDGRVWVGWEQGGHNWGKDQGHWLQKDNRNQGTTLGSSRLVRVACYQNGEVMSAPDLSGILGQNRQGVSRPSAGATLITGPDDRLWLRYRQLQIGKAGNNGRLSRGWTENVTWLTKDGWAPAVEMPASFGRISVFSRIYPAQDGGLLVGYSSDARHVVNFHRPIQDMAFVKSLPKPETEVATPTLEPYKAPEPPAGIPAWNSAMEEKQVAAIRAHRATIGGVEHQIVRGDLHRHTELSWDVGPGNDGSFLDFYRYMIDVAEMDFGGLTDHQGGGGYAYWWWLTEKSSDMYYLAPRFVPLYGYERSARFPNGHRNVFHSYRGVPVFQFQIALGQRGVYPGVGTGELVDNDTKLLYEYLHRSGGIAISHTSGTSSMGTDWRDNDPEIEPVVEIYQGARNSYEALGAPRVHPEDEPPEKAPGGFTKAGMVWKAYEKGYRLGTTASSDHGSTHISYSLVYVTKNDRKEIIDAIRQRHTWGATDNIILEMHTGKGFMGDELPIDGPPSLNIKVIGTETVARLTIVRNNEYVYSSQPGTKEVNFKWVDMKAPTGTNLYYFRIEQSNGEVAWASPVWLKTGG